MLHVLPCQAHRNDCYISSGRWRMLRQHKRFCICCFLTYNYYMSSTYSRHRCIVGHRPLLALPHARLLLIPNSSASLGNHQLLYVLPVWSPPLANRTPVGSPSDDIIMVLFVILVILACFVFLIILANFTNITNNTHFASWNNIANQWTRLSAPVVCRFGKASPFCSSFFSFSSDVCLADDGVPHLCLSPCFWLYHPFVILWPFSFSSPEPSGFVSFPDSGLRSSFWASLLFPPYPNWYMMVENHQRRYLLFWHCPCFCLRRGHLLPSCVASFLFMAGVALFFLCKVSASGVQQVLVTMVPDSFRNLSAAFRIFFLTPGGG